MMSTKKVFACTISDANILATVEKAYRFDFLKENCSASVGFHEDYNI